MKFPTSKDYIYWLLGMGILVIYFATKNLAGNDLIVDYVSFAGGIVSIILALIAIIYSYQQSNQSSENYTETKALLSVISEKAEGINEIKDRVKDTDNNLANLNKHLREQLHTQVEYFNADRKMIEELAEAKLSSTQAYQEFTVSLMPQKYDFKNPPEVDAYEEGIEYLKYFRGVTKDVNAIISNALSDKSNFGFSFHIATYDESLTPNKVKAIFNGYNSEKYKVLFVAKLIFADTNIK